MHAGGETILRGYNTSLGNNKTNVACWSHVCCPGSSGISLTYTSYVYTYTHTYTYTYIHQPVRIDRRVTLGDNRSWETCPSIRCHHVEYPMDSPLKNPSSWHHHHLSTCHPPSQQSRGSNVSNHQQRCVLRAAARNAGPVAPPGDRSGCCAWPGPCISFFFFLCGITRGTYSSLQLSFHAYLLALVWG